VHSCDGDGGDDDGCVVSRELELVELLEAPPRMLSKLFGIPNVRDGRKDGRN